MQPADTEQRCSCGYLAYDQDDLIEHRGLNEHLEAEVERLRASLTRILDAFYIRNGLDNTHLYDAMEDADNDM